MELLTNSIALYLVAINLITFVVFWHDKRLSKRNGWRIPEKTLLGLCLLGGSVGGFLGMKVFHHKTKHRQFSAGIPVMLLIQVGLAVFIWLKFF